MANIFFFAVSVPILLLSEAVFAGSLLRLGSEEIVQLTNPGVDLQVNAYSVPSYVDWNNDGKNDLVIGEGGGGFSAHIKVYLNVGTKHEPVFSDYFYVQSDGANLTHFWDDCYCGCMGLFPRVVYWDADNRKDLITGTADGYVKLFLNIATDDAPNFGSAIVLQVGPAGDKTDIDVGLRSTPIVVDWNNDGKKDLAAGALDGRIHLFINEGTDTEPNFLVETFAQEDGYNLNVPPFPKGRSSPVFFDFDNDGKRDLLSGNTDGQILFYNNVGTSSNPGFSGYSYVDANDIPIDLPDSPRSRPFLCDWTSDGYLDLLVGASDGKVHLYQGIGQLGDVDKDYDVDLADFALFNSHWLDSGCNADNNWCQWTDILGDSEVLLDDLQIFMENWPLPFE